MRIRFAKIELKFNYILKHIRRTKKGCWVWLLSKDKNGYPKMRSKSLGIKSSHHRAAGRVVLVHTLKYDEPDKQVLHTCCTPSCVAPDHLYFGTASQNALDRVRDGHQGFIPPPMRGKDNPWYGKRPPCCDVRTNEEMSQMIRRTWNKLSPKERTARANKVWKTRRSRYGTSGISPRNC
jgi:hypothetical protein